MEAWERSAKREGDMAILVSAWMIGLLAISVLILIAPEIDFGD